MATAATLPSHSPTRTCFALAKGCALGMAALAAQGQAQDFPLWGQTWLFVNGPNEDTHIVRSVAECAPSSVLMAQFNQDGTADLRYSNLSGRFMKSTTEALDSIGIDLHDHVIRNSNLFQASRRSVPDTAYSCDEALAKLTTTLRYSKYVINGLAVAPSLDDRTWQWFFEAPDCYASRPARAQDKEEKNLCQNHWCSDPTDDQYASVQEVCDDAYTECHQGIEESAMRVKPSARYFWNLHVFPHIVLHPRHPATGRIMKEISLSEDEATAKRQEAIDNPSNVDLKPYLNPVMDDSASVYFSGQFLDNGNGQIGMWSLNLDVPAAGDGATGFYHDPPAAYRLLSFTDWPGLQKALLLPFAKDGADRDFLTNLDTRCPGWAFQDRWIGQSAFSVKENLDVTLPDVLPADPSDPAWTKVTQERVDVDGGVEVRTIVAEDRILPGQRALVKNLDFPYGDYFWKGCPDLEDGTFRMTKAELARILAWPVPTCNLAMLSQAEAVYQKIALRFSPDRDPDENALALQRAQEAAFQYDRTRKKERPMDIACPETPLDGLVRKLGGP